LNEIVRHKGESMPELQQRARRTWGLSDDVQIIAIHFVAGNCNGGPPYSDAERAAACIAPQGARR